MSKRIIFFLSSLLFLNNMSYASAPMDVKEPERYTTMSIRAYAGHLYGQRPQLQIILTLNHDEPMEAIRTKLSEIWGIEPKDMELRYSNYLKGPIPLAKTPAELKIQFEEWLEVFLTSPDFLASYIERKIKDFKQHLETALEEGEKKKIEGVIEAFRKGSVVQSVNQPIGPDGWLGDCGWTPDLL